MLYILNNTLNILATLLFYLRIFFNVYELIYSLYIFSLFDFFGYPIQLHDINLYNKRKY